LSGQADDRLRYLIDLPPLPSLTLNRLYFSGMAGRLRQFLKPVFTTETSVRVGQGPYPARTKRWGVWRARARCMRCNMRAVCEAKAESRCTSERAHQTRTSPRPRLQPPRPPLWRQARKRGKCNALSDGARASGPVNDMEAWPEGHAARAGNAAARACERRRHRACARLRCVAAEQRACRVVRLQLSAAGGGGVRPSAVLPCTNNAPERCARSHSHAAGLRREDAARCARRGACSHSLQTLLLQCQNRPTDPPARGGGPCVRGALWATSRAPAAREDGWRDAPAGPVSP